MQLSGERSSGGRGKGRAKALGPGDTRVIGETACRLVWLEQGEREKEERWEVS